MLALGTWMTGTIWGRWDLENSFSSNFSRRRAPRFDYFSDLSRRKWDPEKFPCYIVRPAVIRLCL